MCIKIWGTYTTHPTKFMSNLIWTSHNLDLPPPLARRFCNGFWTLHSSSLLAFQRAISLSVSWESCQRAGLCSKGWWLIKSEKVCIWIRQTSSYRSDYQFDNWQISTPLVSFLWSSWIDMGSIFLDIEWANHSGAVSCSSDVDANWPHSNFAFAGSKPDSTGDCYHALSTILLIKFSSWL